MRFKGLRKCFNYLIVFIPEKYREDFYRENSKINLNRIKTAARLMIVVIILQALVSLIQAGSNVALYLHRTFVYYAALYGLLVVVMSLTVIFLKKAAHLRTSARVLPVFEIAIPAFLLFWALSITMLNQMNHSHIIFYITALLAVGLIQYQQPLLLLSIYASIHLIFLLILPSFQRNPDLLLGHYLNSTIFVILGLLTSRMLFINRRDHFLNRKIIDEQHSRLILLNQQLAALSTIDELTQIPNRRSFNNILEYEWNRSLREGKSISLIMIDVDFFKAYNDNYGHPAGDICLKNVALALQNSVKRSSDFIAKYGGDEFLALLPNTGARGATIVAERVRENIEHLKIPHAFSEISSYVTVSVGAVTMLPEPGYSRRQLLEHADEAMYEAKRGLRNRVVHLEVEPLEQFNYPRQA